ncbi:hypothetical protein C7S18_19800 [Ahniella affigens]|uniref:Uncharacterized protein n=1 Tax=Ahniella affigens TaxID=2021234 RepID=A0A2P1PWN1_9GAMM|nr:hypothetical protein [Ahniella affigens]AVP99271.1 hypothetical protein C7S18_19800 [Ahniella affigens]
MRILLLLALIAISHTTLGRDINPKRLQKIESGGLYSLHEAYVYKSKYYAQKIQHVLMPGPYVEGYRSKDGTYLVGGESSVEIRLLWTGEEGEYVHTTYMTGGVFLPDDQAKLPRMFYVRSSKARTVRTLNGKVVQVWEAGREVPRVQTNPNIATTTVPGASPVAAGVGTAIAFGLINLLIEAGEGKFVTPKRHKGDAAIRDLMLPDEAKDRQVIDYGSSE